MGRKRHPLVDLDQVGKLGQNVFLIAPQVRRSDLLPELARRERYLALEAQGRRYPLDTRYGLLTAPYKKLLEQYADSPATFSTVPSNPAARRDAKIANFKAEKELRARLEFLRSRPDYGAPEDDEDDDADGGDDERGGGARRRAAAAAACCVPCPIKARFPLRPSDSATQ